MTKIALFEDDKSMQSLLKTLLEMEGYQVHTNGRAEEKDLLDEIKQAQPDVVILDVRLGAKDGLQVLRQVREDAQTRRLRVLMISGEDFEHECISGGADGFLLKPFMPDELLTWLRREGN